MHNLLNNFLLYVESWILYPFFSSFSSGTFKIDFIINSCEFQRVAFDAYSFFSPSRISLALTDFRTKFTVLEALNYSL